MLTRPDVIGTETTMYRDQLRVSARAARMDATHGVLLAFGATNPTNVKRAGYRYGE